MSKESFSHDRFRLEKRVNFKFSKEYVELWLYDGVAPTHFRIATGGDSEQLRLTVRLMNCPSTPF
jgi:hypothetical protein